MMLTSTNFSNDSRRFNHLQSSRPIDDSAISRLTEQQVKILSLVADGLLNKQIAFRLGISEATVKAHVSAIFETLEVRGRVQAAVLWVRHHYDRHLMMEMSQPVA